MKHTNEGPLVEGIVGPYTSEADQVVDPPGWKLYLNTISTPVGNRDIVPIISTPPYQLPSLEICPSIQTSWMQMQTGSTYSTLG